jgi:enolase-phosphatase E1
MSSLQGIKAIVTDIEGTTSAISFVHDILFPYAAQNLEIYVRAHENNLSDILNDVRRIENNPSLTVKDIIHILQEWIATDQKITPLKSLQGLIWEEGYKSGAFKGHVYEDAVLALRQWYQSGIKLYVYSSGSVAAQKLIFGYSEFGDLTALFSGYFDTTTGAKRDVVSYKKIASHIGVSPSSILFLSDMIGEIEAANTAGLQVVLVDRNNHHTNLQYSIAQTFHDIIIKDKAA